MFNSSNDGWPLPPLVPQELVFTAEDTKKKPRRILPWKHQQLMMAVLNLSESELEAKRLLDAPKYRCPNLLPCSFKRMRESFQRDGVVDAKWAGKALSGRAVNIECKIHASQPLQSSESSESSDSSDSSASVLHSKQLESGLY